jgi:glycosyltransferase involved in cell wall biosynthesis
MRVLLAHRHLPGQYGRLAAALAEAGDEVVFLHVEPGEAPAGVRAIRAAPTRAATAATHHYVQSFENQVLLGQAVYREAAALARSGWRPDVMAAHAGFGPGLYLPDAFPDAPVVGYFEWFYRARGADADFLDPAAVTPDEALRVRTRNAGILIELAQATRAVAPTRFQREQFPPAVRGHLEVLRDGVDTAFFRPREIAPDALGIAALPADAELVVYATRGLEAYRGFPQFMEAIARLQPARPLLHALVLGEDRTFYGRPPEDGSGWRAIMLERLPHLDRARVHFAGTLPREDYARVLAAAHVHVYLTVPFVPSWSLAEAMASGAPIVGSATAPVAEFLRDGETGLLAELRDPDAVAAAIARLLDDRALARRLGAAARDVAARDWALERLLPRQVALLRETAEFRTKLRDSR